MQKQEFDDFMNFINRSIYLSFCNKVTNSFEVCNIKNIVSDYLYIIDATIEKMKYETKKCTNKKEKLKICKYRKLIQLKYLNKNPLKSSEIEKKLKIEKRHNINDETEKAILYFSKFMIPIAEKKGYHLTNRNISELNILIDSVKYLETQYKSIINL